MSSSALFFLFVSLSLFCFSTSHLIHWSSLTNTSVWKHRRTTSWCVYTFLPFVRTTSWCVYTFLPFVRTTSWFVYTFLPFVRTTSWCVDLSPLCQNNLMVCVHLSHVGQNNLMVCVHRSHVGQNNLKVCVHRSYVGQNNLSHVGHNNLMVCGHRTPFLGGSEQPYGVWTRPAHVGQNNIMVCAHLSHVGQNNVMVFCIPVPSSFGEYASFALYQWQISTFRASQKFDSLGNVKGRESAESCGDQSDSKTVCPVLG